MKRGFGSPNYDPERAASVHAQGGRASQATGRTHRWTSASAARAGQRGGRLRVFHRHAATCPRCAAYFGNDDAEEDLCAAGRALMRRLLEVSAPAPPVMTHGILGAFADTLESATEPRRACHPKVQHLTYHAALAQRRQLLERGLAKNARRIHVYRCADCSRRHERAVFHVGHPGC